MLKNVILGGDKNIDTKILLSLDDKKLLEICEKNKEVFEICIDDTFWMNRTITKFPEVSIDILTTNKGKRTWSNYYINDLRHIRSDNAYEYFKYGLRYDRMDYIIISSRETKNKFLYSYGILVDFDNKKINFWFTTYEKYIEILNLDDVMISNLKKSDYLSHIFENMYGVNIKNINKLKLDVPIPEKFLKYATIYTLSNKITESKIE